MQNRAARCMIQGVFPVQSRPYQLYQNHSRSTLSKPFPINSIKTIPGRRYEPSECCWILPATPESKTLLIQTLEPLARLVFKTPEALKTVKATNAAKTSEVDTFYEHLSRRRYSPNTIKNYLHHAACFHEFCLKQKGNCQEQVETPGTGYRLL